jgi:hypothetical protein
LRIARLTKTASSSVIGEETFKDYCSGFLPKTQDLVGFMLFDVPIAIGIRFQINVTSTLRVKERKSFYESWTPVQIRATPQLQAYSQLI